MKIEQTGIMDLLLVKPRVIGDNRGFFMECFRQDKLEAAGIKTVFIQDNQARSEKAGTVRGLHFQKPRQAQAKYLCVLRGAIFDVAVDLRKQSPTYGQWRSFILSEENQHRLFIPRGFAHGYMTLEPDSEVFYKVDSYYSPKHDAGIFWNDPLLSIDWPDLPALLSDKDGKLPGLADFVSPF